MFADYHIPAAIEIDNILEMTCLVYIFLYFWLINDVYRIRAHL